MSRCITCKKSLNRNKAHMTIELDKINYLVCCPLCQLEFEKFPDKYIRESTSKHSKK